MGFVTSFVYMGGNPKIGGKLPKWMVKKMEDPIKLDDLGVNPTIFGNIHIYSSAFGRGGPPKHFLGKPRMKQTTNLGSVWQLRMGARRSWNWEVFESQRQR